MRAGPPGAVIPTDRLLIRRLESGDAPFVLRLLNEPTFLRFIGDRGVRTLEDADGYIRRQEPREGETAVLGLRLVARREDGTPLGLCGIMRKPWLDAPDLAYAFVPEAEGLGYATEAARAVLAEALGSGDLGRVVAVVVPDNRGSMRVLEKLGFHPEGRVADPADGTGLLRYVLAPDG